MRFLDQFVETWFKRSQDGRRLFFPWGVLSHGYFVPFAEDEERIKVHGKVFLVGCAIIGVLIIVFQEDLFIAGGLFAVLLVSAIIGPLYLKRGLEPSNEKLSFKENLKTQASIFPAWLLWCGLVICGAFVVVSLVLLIVQPQLWLFGGGGILLFGLCGAVYLRMIVVRRARVRSTL